MLESLTLSNQSRNTPSKTETWLLHPLNGEKKKKKKKGNGLKASRLRR